MTKKRIIICEYTENCIIVLETDAPREAIIECIIHCYEEQEKGEDPELFDFLRETYYVNEKGDYDSADYKNEEWEDILQSINSDEFYDREQICKDWKIQKQKEELVAKQKEESLKRMKMLNIIGKAVCEFRNEGKLNYSERAILFWLNEEEERRVRAWEEKTGNLVYHVIKNQMEWGTCYSLLYVSAREDEYGMDRENLKEGFPIVYCMNDGGYGSGYGTIGVRPCMGGVLRTA